ncbi:MAG: haloacid dehalogenase-like hydrolase [Deltaproteobacteria bacterium]|nr:haloacid dehalogenase-like hydrolase [Deltaproteobacteria bacterium]
MLHPTIAPAFETALEKTLASAPPAPRRVAVFDGDNTLWDGDIGEAFLRWLASSGHLVDPPADVWGEYERRVAVDRSAGYGWAVQVMAGLPADRVARWAAAFAYAWPSWRAGMRAILDRIAAAGVETWLVSASSALVVRAAAPFMGIPQDRVLGMEVESSGGLLTDRLIRPLTCAGGKVEAIRRTIGLRPVAAFGDSFGDLEMLEDASAAFVVGQRSRPNAAFLDLAAVRGWPVNVF